ncbi:MAG TPA: molybdenum cofactor biosynthesis protein MoaE [Actinomycetota bacterium]|nr:molybdenum cofactor biosynthesis protein MoaE [Actinomycetota bacterium]
MTGETPFIRTGVTAGRLDVARALADASAPGCGGIGAFVGCVRSSPAAPGRRDAAVVRLEYEAHPTLAAEALDGIARQAARRWNLERVVGLHRTGPCELGEPTVVVACGAAHRGPALEACRWMIDTIKSSVPIWKREVYADGSSWVGSEAGDDRVESTH